MVDLFRPSVGFAAVKLLEDAGLIHTELEPASRGLRKVCSRMYDQITLDLPVGEQTLATGGIIALAAIILGTLCAFLRRITGGVLAPMLAHFFWGLVMVLALPPIFGV